MPNVFSRQTIINLILWLIMLSFWLPYVTIAGTVTSFDDITVSAVVIDPDANGGGGSGGVVIPEIAIKFYGLAYPSAVVHLLENGRDLTKTLADSEGRFEFFLDKNFSQTTLYTLYAIDVKGTKSLLLNYPMVVRTGYITELGNIRFAPTISVDKTEVAKGDFINFSGYALPDKRLEIVILGDMEMTYSLYSQKNGAYSLTTSLPNFPKGDYLIKVRYADSERFSKLVRFLIGDTNRLRIENPLNIPGDCNADDIINLTDFSILAFWYKKSNPPKCVDLNNDKTVNLVDFSILAYYWTG